MRPDQPYDIAEKALAALRDDEPYRNPRLVWDHSKDSSIAGSIFDESRGDARENEASARPKVTTAPVLFAKKMSGEASRRAKGAANPQSSSAEDKWEAYKQKMAVRHGMENAGEVHLKANLSSQVSTALFGLTKAIANPPPRVDGIVWLDGGVWINDRRKTLGENQTGRKRC